MRDLIERFEALLEAEWVSVPESKWRGAGSHKGSGKVRSMDQSVTRQPDGSYKWTADYGGRGDEGTAATEKKAQAASDAAAKVIRKKPDTGLPKGVNPGWEESKTRPGTWTRSGGDRSGSYRSSGGPTAASFSMEVRPDGDRYMWNVYGGADDSWLGGSHEEDAVSAMIAADKFDRRGRGAPKGSDGSGDGWLRYDSKLVKSFGEAQAQIDIHGTLGSGYETFNAYGVPPGGGPIVHAKQTPDGDLGAAKRAAASVAKQLQKDFERAGG